MLKYFKNFWSVIALLFVSISLCILTFLAFINPQLFFFSNLSLQVLLILDVVLLFIFLFIVFKKSSQLYVRWSS